MPIRAPVRGTALLATCQQVELIASELRDFQDEVRNTEGQTGLGWSFSGQLGDAPSLWVTGSPRVDRVLATVKNDSSGPFYLDLVSSRSNLRVFYIYKPLCRARTLCPARRVPWMDEGKKR